jgi:hypothetical protein
MKLNWGHKHKWRDGDCLGTITRNLHCHLNEPFIMWGPPVSRYNNYTYKTILSEHRSNLFITSRFNKLQYHLFFWTRDIYTVECLHCLCNPLGLNPFRFR